MTTAAMMMMSQIQTGRPRRTMFQNRVGFRTVIVVVASGIVAPGVLARIVYVPSATVPGIGSPTVHAPPTPEVVFVAETAAPPEVSRVTTMRRPERPPPPPPVCVTNPSTRRFVPGANGIAASGLIVIVPCGGTRTIVWFAQLFVAMPSTIFPEPVVTVPSDLFEAAMPEWA